jgi:hypothetical protein
MIELKRFIRPGLAISVLGHLGIVVLGLLFAAASGLMPSPPEPTTPVLPDATVVEIVPPNEAPRFEGPTPSEARTSGSQSPLNSTNASAAPQPSRKPTAQQQLQQQPQQPQPQQQQQRAQQQLQQQPQQPQPQQQQQRAQQQRQQQAPAKSPQPDTRPAKAPPPPPPPETAHAETAPPDPAHTETAEPDIAPPDTAQPDVKQTSAPPPPPAPSPFNETADQPPTAETFALLALAGGQLGGGFAAPAVGTNQASDDFTLAFRERVSSCSSLPAGVDRHDKIEVSLRVSFKPDGTLASLPRPLGPITSAKAQAILESSIEALQKCQPYTMLPAAAYKHWKTLDLTFYPLNFGG